MGSQHERRAHSHEAAALGHENRAAHAAPQPSQHPVERLQRLAGNRAVETLLRHGTVVAPRVAVDPPGSRSEREADRIAASMALRVEPPDADRRQHRARKSVVTPPLEASLDAADPSGATAGRFAPDQGFVSRLEQARQGGAVLAARIRDPMESAFGAPLRSVRIHHDAVANELNASLGARAFTVGEHVFFARGHADLASSTGRALLAHELTHVLQQRRMQALHGRASTTLIQRALADHTSFSLARLGGFKDRDDPVLTRQFIRERVGPGTATWSAVTALVLDRYDDYMAHQEQPLWETEYVRLQKAVAALKDYWAKSVPLTDTFRQNWPMLCRSFDIVEAGVLAVSEQPSPAQLLAQNIWNDMKGQFDRWVGGGATHTTRGGWWGSAAPGDTRGATAIPRTAMPYLNSLILGTTWHYDSSDTGGMGFHRVSEPETRREDFIYHTRPP